MSCRVLKRKVENFVLGEIIGVAVENGIKTITGQYIPTPKNGLVKDLFRELEFEEDAAGWHFDVGNWKPDETFIKKTIYDNGQNN